MRETDEFAEPERPGAALDGVDGAEDDVDRLTVGAAGLEFAEAVLQCLEQFLAFDEEGGEDVL
jgi:hypothetical protein